MKRLLLAGVIAGAVLASACDPPTAPTLIVVPVVTHINSVRPVGGGDVSDVSRPQGSVVSILDGVHGD